MPREAVSAGETVVNGLATGFEVGAGFRPELAVVVGQHPELFVATLSKELPDPSPSRHLRSKD